MQIELSKAIEIIELNIREASHKMPPDVKASLQLLVNCAKRIQLGRVSQAAYYQYILPGEAPERTK